MRQKITKLFEFVVKTMITLCLLIMIFGSSFIDQDPFYSDADKILAAPNAEHVLGCDHLGRDLSARIVKGVQSSLYMAMLAVAINFIIGTVFGAIAGYFDNGLSDLIMRLTDMLLAFPGLVLNIAVVGLLGPGFFNTLIAITISGWAEFARLSRVLTLTEKQKEYTITAKLNGVSHFRLFYKYIFPNIFSQLLVFSVASIGRTILRFSGLAFLGLGFQPPTPELGLILAEAKNYMQLAPHYMIYPGIALFIMVFSFNFYADILRDKYDVRSSAVVKG